MLNECSEAYMQQLKQYVIDVVEAEKGNLPGATRMKNKFTWDIIRVASKKAMRQIFQEFEKFLSMTSLEYSHPEATSFRIRPHPKSHTSMSGVAKIIVSIDLQKNDNIVQRVKNRNYIIEVSLHGENDNYLSSTYLGYHKGNHIRFFDNEDFEKNIKNAISEVRRILTHQEFTDRKTANTRYF